MKVASVPTDAAPADVKARGLPASTLVLDERSGSIRAIVNARLLTALRNAAGTQLEYYILARLSSIRIYLLVICMSLIFGMLIM